MGRVAVDETIFGYSATSKPLPFERSQPLIPDVMQIISIVGEGIIPLIKKDAFSDREALAKLATPVAALGKYFEGGKLEKLSAALLHSTSCVADGEVHELIKDGDRKKLFDEHPDLYFPLLFFAGRVTFARFFPDAARLGELIRKALSSQDSNPST